MESTVSLSKGCFVFKNGFNEKRKQKGSKTIPLFDKHFTSENWYLTFKSLWTDIEERIETLNTSTYNKILKELVYFVNNCYNDEISNFFNGVIPCATLLTGINHPDHTIQFKVLKETLLNTVTSHVAILDSQNSSTIKQIVENMVYQFVNKDCFNDNSIDDCNDSIHNEKVLVKKTNCTLNVLSMWFTDLYKTKRDKSQSPTKKRKTKNLTNQLVIIIPDFENFNTESLQDLVLILSSYTPNLPFVLIFGVATSVSALHKNFPYHVSSKLHIQVFQSHSSTAHLNKVIESIFLDENCLFHLSEKPFKLLMDIFLFYDFSVSGFVQGMKFCMMEHFHGSPIKSLCCPNYLIEENISKLTEQDLENVRRLDSFRPYVESKPASTRILLLTDDDYFKIDLVKALNSFHKYLSNFHLMLKLLLIFVKDLPDFPLGKQIRELYSMCISSSIVDSSQYKHCIQLLNFQSKEDILDLLKKSIDLLNEYQYSKNSNQPEKNSKVEVDETYHISIITNNIYNHLKDIDSSDWNNSQKSDESEGIEISENLNRQQLKEKLLSTAAKKITTEFDTAKEKLFKYLTEDIFKVFLKPVQTQPFHEIFFFKDIQNVKRYIVGSPRAAIHTALTNPISYLQCKCCVLPREESILPTLPDLSIVYKLHLECGKLINLYDWLQAFCTIIDPGESDEERRVIDPEIQARFTRAVSEMQFLGFIKTSKRKTDHVTRLTW